MEEPRRILDLAIQKAVINLPNPFIKIQEITDKIEFICRNIQNRAGIRVLLACSLAKIHNPMLDIRKPYTEINTPDCYSGRTYDEAYITEFINKYELPCNPTTAYLTPALRNRNTTLTPDLNLVGKPPKLYKYMLELLTDVYDQRITSEDLLIETIRRLLIIKNEREQRLNSLLNTLKSGEDRIPISAEGIVTLIQQHLSCPKSSRLPVLVVAAAYRSAEKHLGERVLSLQNHTSADEQTGALGDLEITLINDDDVITCYEMKSKKVTNDDINRALQKLEQNKKKIDNYIFITTDIINDSVREYAVSLYEKTGGIEFVILDCIGFLRHFLHLFHRLRVKFVEIYQELVISEPHSAVSQPLKEAFLALRQAAESIE